MMTIAKPPVPRYATSDKTSSAYRAASKLWPVIVTAAIDDVHRTIYVSNDSPKQAEGKVIVEKLAKLKYELQHDRKLTPLVDDGKTDIAAYNEELSSLAAPTWFNAPCLFAACYLFRRMQTCFALEKHWKSYDVFSRQKLSAFKSSRPAVLELAAKYKSLILQTGDAKSAKISEEVEEAERHLFIEMCEICLWGNATDLGLLTCLTYDDIQKIQGADARKKAENNILVNDLPSAYNVLRESQSSGKQDRRVDIVLDNAGFELFVDLVLAGYLIAAGLATQIVLHPKSIPWFVSDVLAADFASLLGFLANPQAFYTTSEGEDAGRTNPPLTEEELSHLSFLFQHLSTLHQEGQLIIRPNQFWTTADSYWKLPEREPRLFQDLQESELVIFKGDLNYRKLIYDATWDSTTPFSTALGPLGPAPGIRILALRTCKADAVVGLPPGEDERLRALEGGGGDSGTREWARTGKWAVVQFCDGKL